MQKQLNKYIGAQIYTRTEQRKIYRQLNIIFIIFQQARYFDQSLFTLQHLATNIKIKQQKNINFLSEPNYPYSYEPEIVCALTNSKFTIYFDLIKKWQRALPKFVRKNARALAKDVTSSPPIIL